MEPLILYFDRCVGKRLPEAMGLLRLKNVSRVFHNNTLRHTAGIKGGSKRAPLFAPDEPDDKWLEFVGSRGWIVFSQDRKFHTSGFENEMFALKHFNVGCFYLWGAAAPTADKALVFLKAYGKIIEAIRDTPRPFIYEITKSGKLKRIDIDEKASRRPRARKTV